jgi:hypothetical protein
MACKAKLYRKTSTNLDGFDVDFARNLQQWCVYSPDP